MNYKINKNIRDNQKLRDSFNALAIKTFDLSFEDWYKGGYWTENYVPYTLLDGEKVVANVSVNIIDTVWQDKPKRYIQLGTIMTDAEYQNKGLSRCLLEKILEEWTDSCDAVYLFANDTVLDFYPKFGFKKEIEYQCSMPISPQTGRFRKLDMLNCDDRTLLADYYAKSNPFSALPVVNNWGLLMFYCAAFIKDYIYFCEDFDAVVIAMQNGENLLCFAVYCDGGKSLPAILSTVANKETNNVVFGFALKDTQNCVFHAIEGEDTLFVLKGKDDIFADHKLMFPILSHA